MRKRLLSACLSLALVCALTSPALAESDPAQFSDAAAITHWDAVAALTQLGIINGKPDGRFDPAGAVTRGEAAKMIFLLMNGGKDTLPDAMEPHAFADCKGHWAEDYIAYCSTLGIVNGSGDGTFRPDDNVTGFEAVKMVLTMLGYDATAYRLTGNSWAVRSDELARKCDPPLYAELSDVVMAQPLTREDTAQILYNAIQNNTNIVVPSGMDAKTGETAWVFKTGDETFLKLCFRLDELPTLPAKPE